MGISSKYIVKYLQVWQTIKFNEKSTNSKRNVVKTRVELINKEGEFRFKKSLKEATRLLDKGPSINYVVSKSAIFDPLLPS